MACRHSYFDVFYFEYFFGSQRLFLKVVAVGAGKVHMKILENPKTFSFN